MEANSILAEIEKLKAEKKELEDRISLLQTKLSESAAAEAAPNTEGKEKATSASLPDPNSEANGAAADEFSSDNVGSSSTAQQAEQFEQKHIDCDAPSSSTPTSSSSTSTSNVGLHSPQGKKHKKNKDIIEESLKVILTTLNNVDGPSVDNCVKVLDGIQGLDHSDPLYVAATLVFTQSKAIREVWMMISEKSEAFKLQWIEKAGKRHGYL